MPTKHIDDSTAAELDELYVRCVTLTQQPVKEVEVLRLAIQKGIKNIADDDILASMSVKNTVWKELADIVWNEVTPCWPLDAITGSNFDALAEAHSKTWQRFPSESCRKALYAELIREHIQLNDPMFSTDDSLFPATDFGMTAEEEQALREERKRLNGEYVASLPALDGRLYSELSSHEKTLTHHYTKRVSFKPDGNGDFLVLVNTGN
ncbi:hypothetical protein ACN5OL_004213 [Cronobacter sakazakii]|uniref:hypothetical protein n=1 Tax=Cronobacter TaxID=413496 RepID=UPI000A106032|nr:MULTISPECIES: hypothetical protein [Cronobacter]ELE8613208.1 hypothetical protein [Escherichia coli]EGT4357312.1 hypothetical protein [Cronobacter sakazakii]ELY2477840.1 hypothetical protein [Cronobacter sakazakii]ELY2562067.1 hypothetical protein [Cronobacter sakazakii]ELY2619459.1 hypothetical protein [Cronobacter sakazakii]